MRKDLLKTLKNIQDEFHCFDERELEWLEQYDDLRLAYLHDKDADLDSVNFRIEYKLGERFDYCLTYNGFGDLDIEYIDKLIEQLKRKRKILEELERFKGIELNEKND